MDDVSQMFHKHSLLFIQTQLKNEKVFIGQQKNVNTTIHQHMLCHKYTPLKTLTMATLFSLSDTIQPPNA